MSKNEFATAPTAVLTPRAYNGVRLHLTVSEADARKVTRGPGYKGIVRDVESGRRFKIRGANCGGDNCWCDATAVEFDECPWTSADECATARERSVAGTDETATRCERHGG